MKGIILSGEFGLPLLIYEVEVARIFLYTNFFDLFCHFIPPLGFSRSKCPSETVFSPSRTVEVKLIYKFFADENFSWGAYARL